jgi:hypothetical protein
MILAVDFMLQILKLAHTIMKEQGQKIGCDPPGFILDCLATNRTFSSGFSISVILLISSRSSLTPKPKGIYVVTLKDLFKKCVT